ncbi:dihydrolipoamide acetyltransferase family protein [Oryzicola mucosus]|uniref:Dihydrolipoamide acetyltransferase component of pyruvate dehydrogenase complex n=1 Tax=Oryzicola mucosus TaxID=2767425 RepID=A0A8J6PJP9_9HYPH|nr:dihydrolipoamide acetyltransferase family protein [Oryzicola mucosus]MBD0415518.1 2-oxo acid dehydrogenase subunit E2 [Oryzicola mucosus]
MAIRIIKLPDIGEGVAEAEVVEWHVQPGQEIGEDDLLAAVMTDKATVEIPSPVAGTVIELGGEVGSVMAVGSKLVAIETEAAGSRLEAETVPVEDAPKAEPAAASVEKPAEKSAPVVEKPKAPIPEKVSRPPAEPVRGTPLEAQAKPVASPAVRGRARDAGVDLRQIRGTGPAGRVTHQDLDAFMASGAVPAASSRTPRREGVEQIKIVGLRRRIAEKMAESTRKIAHFAYVEEVDMTALEELRAHLNKRHPDRPKLTVLPFIVRALTQALRDFPQMNALYDDDAEVVSRYAAAHVGIAAQTPNGLMVPVLKHAETLDLWQTAQEIRRLAEAARDGTAKRDELSGSTITISSLGDLGGIVSTPVINRPEVAIVGINKMAIRPVWQDDRFVPRKMMNLSSSFDHRVVDGHDAASFIRAIKERLELPATLFIEA